MSRLLPILVLVCGNVAYVSDAAAQGEKLLYSFTGAPDGATPIAGLAADKDANLYGATLSGGNTSYVGSGCGTIFELKRTGNSFTESVIRSFGWDPPHRNFDGCAPQGTPVVDRAGNVYGTTGLGGAYLGGTLFVLSPNPSGGWTEKILWNFGGVTNGEQDGKVPISRLTFDSAGNLYSTTFDGGGAVNSLTCGMVFEMSPSSAGWNETVLHSFPCENFPRSGWYPAGGVTFDNAGNLYGATTNGGQYAYCQSGCGTIFKLEKAAGWKEQQLYAYTGLSDGAYPNGDLIFDQAGHIYGTTYQGPGNTGGDVFELADTGTGWKQEVLYSFTDAADGWVPAAGLAAWNGHYYGTAAYGQSSAACFPGCGSIFAVTPSANGWIETVVHVFQGPPTDGANPRSSVIVDPAGRLYGTTEAGGVNNLGAVFEVTP